MWQSWPMSLTSGVFLPCARGAVSAGGGDGARVLDVCVLQRLLLKAQKSPLR